MKIYPYLKELQEDLDNYLLPRDLNNYSKVHCQLFFGNRIFWYYKDDEEFFINDGESIEDYKNNIYSGLVVGKQDIDSGGELEIDNCVIVMDQYPCEKECPQYTWFALKRLLDHEDLVKVFEKK